MNKLGQEPAFPVIDDGKQSTRIYKGVSTRLYVATAAMQGILASYAGIEIESFPLKYVVNESLRLTDALLEEELKTRTDERQD